MKIVLITAISLLSIGTSYSATIDTYTASADPASSPDANGQTVNAWTVTGGTGVSLYTNGNWGIQEFNNPATATHIFDGGALTDGDSVSIDYAHGAAIDSGSRVGIRLLDASNTVESEFSFLGGDSDGFEYGDLATGFAYAATGKTYDANDLFTVTYTVGAGDTYSAKASLGMNGGGGTGAWSGSFVDPITQIQVFTNGGYNFTDSIQQFNDLSVVGTPLSAPEPSTFATLIGSLGLLVFLLRRKRSQFLTVMVE